MLRALAYGIQAALLALVAYNALTSLWGWRVPPPALPGERRRRFRVVIPAHNEEAVIGLLLGDLASQAYDPQLVTIWVVADRCRDRTAAVASRWAQVAERSQGPEGKGAALAWFLEGQPLQADEALVVLDADNRAPPDLLARLADEIEVGHEALQAYLDVANPEGSWLATASALSYWASNRMVQLARHNLGWSADLGGTGMCLTSSALEAAGGFGTSPTEDQELTARLVLADLPVGWLHDLRVRDEKPVGVGVAVRQRARWKTGWSQVTRRSLGPLLMRAWRRRSPAAFDLAVRLVQPSRTLLASQAVLLGGLGAVRPSPLVLPWPVWAGAAGAQLILPLAFLIREGVPPRYLVRYPLLAVYPLLWLPVRVVSRWGARGWYHTPHGMGKAQNR
jgi:cellulose synthase/poly-beta-1,6-N-acetylglucosamine synthase-like glycosyltransferase